MQTALESANEASIAEQPFEEFFHAQYRGLVRLLYLVSGDTHEAEDLAQDALVRVLERWDRVRRHPDPPAYLFRVALNLRRSRLRRVAMAARKSIGRLESDPIEATEQRDRIRRALRRLPPAQREALVLVEWLGLSDREAAAVLHIRPGSVRVRLSRARPKLRDALGGDLSE